MITTAPPESPKQKEKGKRSSFPSNFARLNIPLHGVRLPSFKIEDRYINDLALPADISTYDFLRELCLLRFTHLGLDKGKLKKVVTESTDSLVIEHQKRWSRNDVLTDGDHVDLR